MTWCRLLEPKSGPNANKGNPLDIKDIKDLEKVIRLCRKTGVSDIEIAGIKMHIGPITDYGSNALKNDLNAFPEASVRVPTYTPIQAQETQDEPIKMPDALTEEQLMFYSAKQEPN